MTRILSAFLLLFVVISAYPQAYLSRTAHINVRSANKVQNIVADNYQVACQLNTQSGLFKINMLIKSFEFQIGAVNRVMNSRDINVTEFPRITYDGQIENLNRINFSKPGTYPAKFKGTLYIWDEKRLTDADGTLTVLADGSIEGRAAFSITIEDKNMKKIDTLMKQKLPASLNIQTSTMGISKTIELKADAILKKQ